MSSATRRPWTRDELLVALAVYRLLPFGQFDTRNPVVCAVSQKIGRTPGSLAMKLNNFTSLDPRQRERGISGLRGCSHLDRQIWTEFNDNINEAQKRGEALLRTRFGVQDGDALVVSPKDGVQIRRCQEQAAYTASTFRDAVLDNYGGQCGVTRSDIRDLLDAVSILPFTDEAPKRFAVENGLCLSRIHATAFTAGLMCFDADLCVRFSPHLTTSERVNPFVHHAFLELEGRPLYLPQGAIPPSPDHLAYHCEHIFKRG